MKSDDPSIQLKTEDSHKSLEDEATIKDGMRVGLILTAVNFAGLGLILLSIQCGVDCLDPDMVLYNNTGGEITIFLGNEPTVVEKGSMGRVRQPIADSFWRHKSYRLFSIRTEKRRWSYFVVEPPSGYEKRGSSRKEYWYQIEADGTIYLLLSTSEFPVQNLPPQPSGFPWLPQFS